MFLQFEPPKVHTYYSMRDKTAAYNNLTMGKLNLKDTEREQESKTIGKII